MLITKMLTQDTPILNWAVLTALLRWQFCFCLMLSTPGLSIVNVHWCRNNDGSYLHFMDKHPAGTLVNSDIFWLKFYFYISVFEVFRKNLNISQKIVWHINVIIYCFLLSRYIRWLQFSYLVLTNVCAYFAKQN